MSVYLLLKIYKIIMYLNSKYVQILQNIVWVVIIISVLVKIFIGT